MAKNTTKTFSNTTLNGNNRRFINQVPIGIGVFCLIVVFGFFLTTISKDLTIYWITGIAFGFILQKSRFCFTASIRDPYLTGSTSLTKAVLIALAITTIGFTAIKYGSYINHQIILGQEYVRPITLSTALGGILFGIGMVISSGCASGTIMRVGEGFQMQAISLLFFVIGSIWGAHDMGWWSNNFVLSEGIFLPDTFGWIGAVVIQLLFIAFLFVVADKWEEKKL